MDQAFKSFYLTTAIFVAAFICFLPLFAHLSRSPIYMWDEATYANNALDMYISHDPLVVRMEGQPDLYNTKPPFVLWMQTLSLNLFGLNEWAIRFPSALFTAFTMLLLLWFSIYLLQSYWIGFVAMLTLACSNGYVSDHGARSGDLDATLVFWMTLYALFYLKFLMQRKNIAGHFAIISAGLVGAFLSKGIAGFFFIPFLIIITILNKSFIDLLKRKEVYISGIIVILFCGGYYLLREWAAPGYWNVVFKSEFSRYGKAVMSWHVEPFDFYFRNFINGRFTPFIYLLSLSVLIPFISRDQLIRKLTLYLWILCGGYFVLISFPADKLEWYDEPLYPLFGLIIGISVVTIIQKCIGLLKWEKNQTLQVCLYLFVISLIFSMPYLAMIDKVYAKDNIKYDYDSLQTDVFRINGAYMKYLHKNFHELRNYSVFKSPPYDPEHEDQLKFYQRIYSMSDSSHIQIKHFEKQLNSGEFIMVCEKNKLDSIQNDFHYSLINSWNGCDFLRLNSRKN